MTIPSATQAWKQASNTLGATVPGTVDTVKRVPLGTVRTFYDANYGAGEFIYLQGIGSVAQDDVVSYHANYVVARTASSTGNVWAVASAAIVASTYGWFQIGGLTKVNKTKTVSFAAGALVGVSTAGLISASSSLKELSGAIVAIVASATTTTNNGNKIALMLSRPTGMARIT
jgi:hypothetical protein